MDKVFVLILSFISTLFAIHKIIKLSNKYEFGLDLPGKRKIHKISVPRIGGVGILFGLIVVVFFLNTDKQVLSYFFASLIVFIVSLIDDIKGVKWLPKMAAICLAITVTIFYGDIVIYNLGNIFGLGRLDLGIWSIPFTYFSVLGIVCAINLLDGLNGLAGGTSVIIFISLAFFSYITGKYNFMYISFAMIGGLLAFLRYNFPRGLIFLGDSGSNLVGFTIAIICVVVFQNNTSYEPMIPVLLLGIPIFDTVRVMIRRMLKGRNPFSADKNHMHHVLVRMGLCDKKTVLLMWLLSLMFGITAIIMRKEEGWKFFLILINSLGIIVIFLRILFELKKTKKIKNIIPARANGR